MVARPAAGEFALEKDDIAEQERCARKIAMKREKRRDRPRRPVETGERDVGREGAGLGRDPDAHKALVNLPVERRQQGVGLDPCPEAMGASLPLECPDP